MLMTLSKSVFRRWKSIKCVRRFSKSGDRFPEINIAEFFPNGTMTHRMMKADRILNQVGTLEKRLPLRDLRILSCPPPSSSSTTSSYPSISPRPSSRCFIVDLHYVKALCREDRCLILHPHSPKVRSFLNHLETKFRRNENNRAKIRQSNLYSDYFLDSHSGESLSFELCILEAALSDVTSHFHRHLRLINPILELLLHETSKDPSALMLRRLFAFRKSLSAFEVEVEQVQNAVCGILNVDQDMEALYLSKPTQPGDHEEVELMLEAYHINLKEIESKIQEMKAAIEETNDFINTHLNTLRNRIIRMSLFMEIGTLSAGVGALIAGIFGMNLTHGFEDHTTAFYLTTGYISTLGLCVFATFSLRYKALTFDTSGARSYQALKNFFTYVDDLEYSMQVGEGGSAKLDRKEFKKLLMNVVGSDIAEEEVDLIFKIFDRDKDGFVELKEVSHE